VWAKSQYRSEEFLVTSSFDGSLGLWMLFNGTQFDPHIYIRIENAHGFGWTGEEKSEEDVPCEVLCVAFHVPSQLIVSGGNDSFGRCWCSLDRSARYLLRGHSNAVTCCSADEASGLVFTGSTDSNILAWNLGASRVTEGRLETLSALFALSGHAGSIRCLFHIPFENDTSRIFLASASEDSIVKVWSCRTASALHEADYGGRGTTFSAGNESKEEDIAEESTTKQPMGQHVFDITVCTEDSPPRCVGCLPPQSGTASNILIGTVSGSIIKVQLPSEIFT